MDDPWSGEPAGESGPPAPPPAGPSSKKPHPRGHQNVDSRLLTYTPLMAAGGGGVHGSTQRHGRPNLSTPTDVTKHITSVIVPSYGREIRPPWLISF